MKSETIKSKEFCAEEIAKDINFETEIRTACRSGRVSCAYNECGQPVTYNHGEIKRAYFSHQKNRKVVIMRFI